MPGYHIDEKGNIALMNVMCDMSQFVAVVPVPDESSVILASYFMQHVLMKFSLCHFVVLDDGNPFKGAFIDMYQALTPNYDIYGNRTIRGSLLNIFVAFYRNM